MNELAPWTKIGKSIEGLDMYLIEGYDQALSPVRERFRYLQDENMGYQRDTTIVSVATHGNAQYTVHVKLSLWTKEGEFLGYQDGVYAHFHLGKAETVATRRAFDAWGIGIYLDPDTVIEGAPLEIISIPNMEIEDLRVTPTNKKKLSPKETSDAFGQIAKTKAKQKPGK